MWDLESEHEHCFCAFLPSDLFLCLFRPRYKTNCSLQITWCLLLSSRLGFCRSYFYFGIISLWCLHPAVCDCFKCQSSPAAALITNRSTIIAPIHPFSVTYPLHSKKYDFFPPFLRLLVPCGELEPFLVSWGVYCKPFSQSACLEPKTSSLFIWMKSVCSLWVQRWCK